MGGGGGGEPRRGVTIYGDQILTFLIYPKPYSIYLRGTVASGATAEAAVVVIASVVGIIV